MLSVLFALPSSLRGRDARQHPRVPATLRKSFEPQLYPVTIPEEVIGIFNHDRYAKFNWVTSGRAGKPCKEADDALDARAFTDVTHQCPVCGERIRGALQILHHGMPARRLDALFYSDTVIPTRTLRPMSMLERDTLDLTGGPADWMPFIERNALLLTGVDAVRTMGLCLKRRRTRS